MRIISQALPPAAAVGVGAAPNIPPAGDAAAGAAPNIPPAGAVAAGAAPNSPPPAAAAGAAPNAAGDAAGAAPKARVHKPNTIGVKTGVKGVAGGSWGVNGVSRGRQRGVKGSSEGSQRGINGCPTEGRRRSGRTAKGPGGGGRTEHPSRGRGDRSSTEHAPAGGRCGRRSEPRSRRRRGGSPEATTAESRRCVAAQVEIESERRKQSMKV